MSKELLSKLIRGKDLETEEARELMESIMTGKSEGNMTAALLTALACKGESGAEIAVFAETMRKAARKWPSSMEQKTKALSILCDTCGTGGDGASSMNISTLAAIILASLGIPVAKHGNRAVSSKSGSADLLEALGINLDMSPENLCKCLEEVGICFLYAPSWHPAMKHVAPVRKALKARTVFNLLGPLSNPAPVSHQVLGVFDRSFQKVMAQALAQLGRQAYIVCSKDGLDEVSWSAPTHFIYVKGGKIQEEGELEPEDFGFVKHSRELLQISGIEEAKKRSIALLSGEGSEAEKHALAMNAALAYSLIKGEDLKISAQKCIGALAEGKGLRLIERWRSFA